MKHTFLFYIFAFFSLLSKATECAETTFQEEHLNLYICQNYSNYNESRTLLFKTRASILNNYIKEKIKSGQLIDKKVEIQIYDPILSQQHLNISQGENGYYVSYSSFASIQELIIIIDYFAKPFKTAFFTSDHQNFSSEIISNQIEQFFNKNKSSGIILPKLKIWSLEELDMFYIDDKLKYFINDQDINIEANSTLPIKIRERFLLFQSDTIFVFEGQHITLKFPIKKLISGDYTINVYDKWVNIYENGDNRWIFSYSYEKNKFYKNKILSEVHLRLNSQ